MSLNVKSLAKSALTETEGANLYAPAAGKAAILKGIRLVNTGAAPATVNLSVRRGASGTYYRIAPKNLSLSPGVMYCDEQEVTLEGGDGSTTQDHILGWVSSGGTVDFVISGVEREQS
jgi:hypothetical protein